jgi:hypothetical protein
MPSLLSEVALCPVWAMLKDSGEIVAELKLVTA